MIIKLPVLSLVQILLKSKFQKQFFFLFFLILSKEYFFRKKNTTSRYSHILQIAEKIFYSILFGLFICSFSHPYYSPHSSLVTRPQF